MTVEKQLLHREVRLSGSVMTAHFSHVSAEVAGLIDRLEIEEGDSVESGEVLCSLDPTVRRHELEGARAELAATKARLSESKRLLREARSLSKDKIVPQTELAAKRAKVEILRANLRRQKAETNRIHERRRPSGVSSMGAGRPRSNR